MGLHALLARTAGALGRPEPAGALWGAVESEEKRGTVGQWEGEREHYGALVLEYEDEDFARGRSRGRELSLDEAVELALSVDSAS